MPGKKLKKIKKSVDKGRVFWYNIFCQLIRQTLFGEMSEWLKEPVLKTGDGSAVRGFESHSLLHL